MQMGGRHREMLFWVQFSVWVYNMGERFVWVRSVSHSLFGNRCFLFVCLKVNTDFHGASLSTSYSKMIFQRRIFQDLQLLPFHNKQ